MAGAEQTVRAYQGQADKGKKTHNSKACKSAIAPSQNVCVPQNECSGRVYVSMANPTDQPMEDCTSTELGCSEVEVGMWDEATDSTTRGSGRVNHRKQQDGRRLNTSDSGIQNTNVPDSAKLEKTAVKELVRTSYSAEVDSSPPCSSCVSTTPSNPVHVDSSPPCSSCVSTTPSNPVHVDSSPPCSSCVSTTPSNSVHVDSSPPCSSCVSTTPSNPVHVDSSPPCSSCVSTTPSNPVHVDSSPPCSSCVSTTPSNPVHVDSSPPCSSCVSTTPSNPVHVDSSPPCSSCVSTTPSNPVHVDSSPPCSSCVSTTPSNSVHVDVCASTLPLPISTLSSPISSVSSEMCVLGVDGGNVGTSRELPHPAQQGSMNVLLEHCETVSTCFKEFASRTTCKLSLCMYGSDEVTGYILLVWILFYSGSYSRAAFVTLGSLLQNDPHATHLQSIS